MTDDGVNEEICILTDQEMHDTASRFCVVFVFCDASCSLGIPALKAATRVT